jgi:hypothetical protein
MGLHLEDDPPLIPVEPAPEPATSTRRTDPTPSEDVDDVLGEIRTALRAMRERDERNANELMRLSQSVNSFEGKLDLAFGVLSEKVGASETRIVDAMRRELASLDRQTQRYVDDHVRGPLGELANNVSAIRDALDHHVTGNGHSNGNGHGNGNGEDSEGDRLTMASAEE